ncbi:helix-turn-helix domain-containing protein [Konateibacter massiliensis]|uniref:helix-turn-helix domain-containing protein n=1 Tax=Konateibacter massiliensis TaxID=2002841 RepID=UPI000C14A517|nr:helix-turn-helix transcriptional regulator [Konateibacter massiliensis]
MTGVEFRKWRREREISQQEVAEFAGCNKSTICRWEKNNINLVPELYERVMEFIRFKMNLTRSLF